MPLCAVLSLNAFGTLMCEPPSQCQEDSLKCQFLLRKFDLNDILIRKRILKLEPSATATLLVKAYVLYRRWCAYRGRYWLLISDLVESRVLRYASVPPPNRSSHRSAQYFNTSAVRAVRMFPWLTKIRNSISSKEIEFKFNTPRSSSKLEIGDHRVTTRAQLSGP